MNNNILFQYVLKLSDSPMVINGLRIPNNENVVYVAPWTFSTDYNTVDNKISWTVPVSAEAIQKVKKVLTEHSEVFQITELEESPYCKTLDGVCQSFTFGNGETEHTIEGYNIQNCQGEKELCPNAALVIKVLKRIRKILVAEGVDVNCFYLGHRSKKPKEHL